MGGRHDSVVGVDAVTLADYRERVARMYLADTDLAGFRAARDELFATHPQSPVPAEERAGFAGARYFPENSAARVTVAMTPADESNAALRDWRVRSWRDRVAPSGYAFPGDPRDWEKTRYDRARLTPLGEKLLGLRRWDDADPAG